MEQVAARDQNDKLPVRTWDGVMDAHPSKHLRHLRDRVSGETPLLEEVKGETLIGGRYHFSSAGPIYHGHEAVPATTDRNTHVRLLNCPQLENNSGHSVEHPDEEMCLSSACST